MKPIDFERHFPWYVDSSDTDNIDCQCGDPCDGIAGWATHIARAIKERCVECWGSGYLVDDLADKLRCEEVDALAAILAEFGAANAANQWLSVHALSDECGDTHCACRNCSANESGGGAS